MADIMPAGDPVRTHDPSEFGSRAGSPGSWIGEELRWAGGVFGKIALTIVVSRTIARFFGVSFVRLNEKAGDLAHFGRVKKPYSDPKPGGFAQPSGPSSGFAGAGSGFSRKSEAPPAPSGGPRMVKEVGGVRLWHHGSTRENWLWPCPITSPQECRDCEWFVLGSAGTAYCTAVEKLKQVLAGRDDGSDLYDMRERLRRV